MDPKPKTLALALLGLLFANNLKSENLPPPAAPDSVQPASAAQAPLDPLSIQPSLVTIEYNYAERAAGATGFIANWNGKPYVFTNIHVLHGAGSSEANLLWTEGPLDPANNVSRLSNKSRLRTSFQEFQKNLSAAPLPKIKSLDGTEVRVAPDFLFSKARDVVLMPVVGPPKTLSIAKAPPSPGCRLLIAGNPEAEHTISTIDATLSAVGPERLEVEPTTGKLQPGMSGGPVVDVATGKVVGITTYAVKKFEHSGDKYEVERIEFDNGAGITRRKATFELTVRNFAFRLDNLSDFQVVQWGAFLKDCGILCAMEERSMNVFRAAHAPSGLAGFREKTYELPPDIDSSINLSMGSAVSSFKMASGKPAELDKAWKIYQTKLGNLLNQDFQNPALRIKTAYLARIANEDIGAERRLVASKLRALGGKYPTRGE